MENTFRMRFIGRLFHSWKREVAIKRNMYRQRQIFRTQLELIMRRWYEGKAKGMKDMVLREWKRFVDEKNAAKSVDDVIKERDINEKKLKDMLSGELAKQEQKAANEAARKKEAARLAVEMIVKKWEMGNKKGTLLEVYGVWAKYAMKWNQIRRSKADAQIALAKFLEGDRKGILHVCLLHWSKETQDVRAVRQKEKIVEDEKNRFNAFLDQQHRDWQMSAEEARKEAAMKAVQTILKKWLAGEKKGLLIMSHSSWQEYVKKQKAADQQFQAVKVCVLKWVEGDKRALLQTCFSSWSHEARDHSHSTAIETHQTVTIKLEEERTHLLEQLNLAYSQLDGVTETLQKELKTKEELARELREANENMRKTQMEMDGSTSGSYYIDVQSVLKSPRGARSASRNTSPGTTKSPSSLHDSAYTKEDSSYSPHLLTPRTYQIRRNVTPQSIHTLQG